MNCVFTEKPGNETNGKRGLRERREQLPRIERECRFRVGFARVQAITSSEDAVESRLLSLSLSLSRLLVRSSPSALCIPRCAKPSGFPVEDRESVRNCAAADPPLPSQRGGGYRLAIGKNARWHAAWTFTDCEQAAVAARSGWADWQLEGD